MTTQYTIAILNLTGETQSYILWQAAPTIEGVSPARVFTPIFLTASSGHAKRAVLHFSSDVFAVCGTSPGPLGPGHTVDVGSSEKVSYGADSPGSDFFLTVTDDTPSWDESQTNTTDSEDGFAITTDTNFSRINTNFIFIGTGAEGPGDVAVTCAFPAEPGTTCTIKPMPVFYVATGHYSPGTIIDTRQLMMTALKIDFGQSSPVQSFIYEATGRFRPQ